MADEKKVTDAEVAEKKAKKTDKKKSKKAPSKFSPKNVGKAIARFFKDLRGETKKIVWPGPKMVVFLFLHSVVIALFTFCAGKCNFNSHERHLHFLISLPLLN